MGANNTEGTHSIRSRVGLLAAALVIVATACGCQQNTPAAQGPWAADIEQARSEWASNEFVQSVLADSSISEAELQDMRQRVLNCLTDKGVTGASFGPSGTLSVPDQPVGSSISEEQQQEFVYTCSIDAGQPIIEALEFDMRVNPDHRDVNELFTQCLIRNKAVEPSFTAQELARARESGTPLASALPFIDPSQGPDILRRCLEDPSK
ncbi:hypothetical protein [Schaalia dentiphila]|jgi:hypothetical protein|uniref:Lipoprotein n=1 Tax=Schaalia dentiphila ATCC 17982 TaxID=411466 RepID=A7BE06_9ACTO|nr:hypothetical protein [Schaalia odontolytica]EDN81430.1 hypothetical protein ACTODO_01907 [Schaalia odontolytica ATCC 17982]